MEVLCTVIHVLILSICLTFMRSVEGHGRLMVPPSRSSMWRYGFNTPVNYQDNELYCGGFTHQWNTNGGKCGICGDPYDGVRENEAGGKYATGTISRTYQPGTLIEVSVQITAHHKGWFEFRLCPNNNPQVAATHDCLDKNLLQLGDGTTRYMLPQTSKSGDVHKVMLQLPAGLTCTQCVFQWKYHTGNSWGCDANGCAVGNGPQEEFYGCADITIVSSGATSGTTSTTKPTSVITDKTTTSAAATTTTTNVGPTASTTATSTSTAAATTTTTNVDPTASTTATSTSTAAATTTRTTTKPTTTRPAEVGKVCKSAGAWKGQSSMDAWCKNNCAVGFCPATHCKCEIITAATTQPTTASTTKAATTQPTTASTTKAATTQPTTASTTKAATTQSTTASTTKAATTQPTTASTTKAATTQSTTASTTKAATTQPTTASTTKAATKKLGSTTESTTTSAQSTTTQETTTKNLICTTYKSINGSSFEDQVCEYSCLIEKNCPQDQCMCSSTSQPKTPIKNCQGPTGIDNADKYCTAMCTYSTCPSECQC